MNQLNRSGNMPPPMTTTRERHTGQAEATDSSSDVGEDARSTEDNRPTPVNRSSNQPMKEPLTAPWALPLSDTDLEKLKRGFWPRDMDDKWHIKVEDPDESGNISIRIRRSWTQMEIYILHIVVSSGHDDGTSAGPTIQSITWEGNRNGWQSDAEQTKKEAVHLCRGLLGCQFETLPRYPADEVWNFSAYKRLEAE